MLPAERNVSPLESLPIELLEPIFFQPLNVNFPLASSHLGTVLSSTPTKFTLLSKVFPGDISLNELEQILRAKNKSDTEKAIGELQSKILACRWMTGDFLEFFMEKSFSRASV